MELNQLFQVALGINSPWYIEGVRLDDANKKCKSLDLIGQSPFN
jgi:hypothetical protein